jgi:hypothetical protein
MPNYRVSLAFTKVSDASLGEFVLTVVDSMTSNPAYPTPTVPIPDLAAARTAFLRALSASEVGGMLATATKNESREALLKLMRKQAAYVQGEMGDDFATLLSSGFESVSRNRTRIQLPPPRVERIRNERSAQLVVDLAPMANARAYEVQKMNGTGGWMPVGIFTQSRRIVLEGLNPGSIYTVQARAVGGTTGYSDWSDPVSHMSL